jgi:hypothetical protein
VAMPRKNPLSSSSSDSDETGSDDSVSSHQPKKRKKDKRNRTPGKTKKYAYDDEAASSAENTPKKKTDDIGGLPRAADIAQRGRSEQSSDRKRMISDVSTQLMLTYTNIYLNRLTVGLTYSTLKRLTTTTIGRSPR